jgi:dolichol-phosphate mannosyltransferase
MIFRSRDLHNLAADASGPFTRAEVLARAHRLDLPVAEVPVTVSPRPDISPGPRWRSLPGTFLSFLNFWWSRIQFPGTAPPRTRKASWLFGLLLMLLAALLLFPELNEPLQDPDEGRQAEVPREMLAHDDLLMPRMLGQPYYEKPPLQYWLTAASYTLFGVHPWAARLIPALAAWFTVLFSYLWGRRWLGSRAAFLGGLVLCLSVGFIAMGRTVILDSLLTACVAASWYTAHRAVAEAPLRWRWWLLSALICGLGILSKGPVALILLIFPLGAYQCLNAGAARPRLWPWCYYLGVVLLVAAPWYLAMALNDPSFVSQFLWKANVVRFVEAYDHKQPWWYYLPLLFTATLPWSLLWTWLGYFLCADSRRVVMLRTPALGFCAVSVAWCLVFFSLSGCKSPFYVAPALPPLALMLGVCLEAILFRRAGHIDRFMGYARRTLPYQATVVILLVSIGGYAVAGLLKWETWGLVLVEMALTLAGLVLWWRFGRSLGPKLAWATCGLATLIMVAVAARDLVVGFARTHTIQTIARIARHWPDGDKRLVFSYGRQWPSASFYLRRDHVIFVTREARPLLMELLKKQPDAMILVERGELLDELLASLPPGLKADVTLPAQEGQAALMVVHRPHPLLRLRAH